MWFPIVVATPPAAEPLSLVKAKAHLRVSVDTTHEDDGISDSIAAARAHVERVTGTRLYTQTLTLRCDCWADLARFPTAPIQSVTVSYVDGDGATQTLSASVYEARLYGLEPGLILAYGQSWPTIRVGSLITVAAVAGYGVEAAQPPDIMHALKLIVGDLFAFRETAVDGAASALPSAANIEALLSAHRFHLIV